MLDKSDAAPFKQAVFLDKELWRHFGSEERVLEALRMLVSLAERSWPLDTSTPKQKSQLSLAFVSLAHPVRRI